MNDSRRPRQVTVPSQRQIFTLPWSAFPASLEADVEAYLRRAAGVVLDDEHFIRAQRPTTLKGRRSQLRWFATAIAKSGFLSPEELGSLPVLLNHKVAASGLQFPRDRNGGKSSAALSNLAEFLPTLARRLDMPLAEIVILTKMKQKLKVSRNGMTERNREALSAFDDPVEVERLLSLPFRIRREVEASGRKGHREVRLIETALAVELLLNAPVRIQNLASIEIDRHLIEVGGPRNRTLHLRFPAAEVKNANDLEFPLMPETVALLEAWLAKWRPLLMIGDRPFLFPSRRCDRYKRTESLSSQIKEVVYAYTRLDMPAHRFRHAVAKIFLDRNPGQYEVVRLLLGHKSMQTTISFYAGAESATAARHYADTVLQNRSDFTPSE